MARPERLELPTPRFVVWCSIQLSYGRIGRRESRATLAARLRDSKTHAPVRTGLSLSMASLKIASGVAGMPGMHVVGIGRHVGRGMPANTHVAQQRKR